MTRFREFFKYFYIVGILVIFYIPLFFAAIFSFNETSDKGFITFTHWNGFTWEAYENLFSDKMVAAFMSSLLLGTLSSLIVIIFSLLTVFSIWKQKSRTIKVIRNVSTNISLINPDVIIGISLAIFFTLSFGVLSSESEGFGRALIGHVVMILPYGILIMYPKSEKFNKSIFEASYDLGYSKIKTWFNTYFIYMLPSITFTLLVSMVLSFDDFIITTITSNTQTVGTELYQGRFQSWALALGSILLVSVITLNAALFIKNSRKADKIYER
ncbi:MAG: ABC transporter permease [Metamycoplasmataceae bacterium]